MSQRKVMLTLPTRTLLVADLELRRHPGLKGSPASEFSCRPTECWSKRTERHCRGEMLQAAGRPRPDTTTRVVENTGGGGKRGMKELNSHSGWLANRSA